MKKLTALLLTLCMTLSLCACGPTEGTGTPSGNPSPSAANPATPSQPAAPSQSQVPESSLPAGPVEIEMWTDMTIADEILIDTVARFEEAYADQGYTVVLNKFAGSQRSALISAAKETKTLPALLLSAWFTTSDYVHQGMIADITDIASAVQNDMYASTYDATLIDGKNYMVGLYQSYFGFLYNADMLKDAGLEKFVPEDPNEVSAWTVTQLEEEILPALTKSMKGTEKYPISFFAADNQGDTFMMNWLTMLGGNLWKEGASVAGEDPNTVAALERMIDWTNKGYTNSNVITKSGAEVNGEFKNGVSAISSGQYTTYTANLRSMEKGESEPFDIRIGAIPVQKDGKDSATMANYVYGASVMNNGKEEQMAVAKEFIRWLLNDQESLTAINTNAIPCFKSITETVAAENPLYVSLTEMESSIWDFTGGVAGYVSTRALLFPEMQAAFGGTKSAAQAMTDYSAGANKIIDEYMENSLVLN